MAAVDVEDVDVEPASVAVDLEAEAAQEPSGASNPLTGIPYTRRFYELLDMRQKLPAWASREDFLRLVHAHQVTLVVGGPGSGKSTQVPQILLDAGYHVLGGAIKSLVCVQPHDTAALLAAQRIADELEVPLGTHVGYGGHFEDKSSQDSLLKLLSDHALLRELMLDPLLERYSVVIIDEVHERSAASDALLALLRRVLQRRPELKLIVMSATMDAKRLQGYFGGAPLLRMPGRTHPVEVYYMPEPHRDYLWTAARTVIQIHRNEALGDVLLFLPTEEEVDRACRMLQKEAESSRDVGELLVVPMHAGLLAQEQQRALDVKPVPALPGFKPGRKVVVATSEAETSVAIDGIVFVVDTGVERQQYYNPRIRLSCARVTAVSRAKSLRRADCAGRAGPGKCYRLYNERVFMQELSEQSYPEMMRVDITGLVLTMKRLGVSDLLRFELLDPPPPEALMRAIETLNHLGMLDDSGDMTQLGVQAAALPVDPQLARMLLEAPGHRCTSEALSIAAMLSAGNVFLKPQGREKDAERAKLFFTHLDGDHLTLLNVYHAYKQHLMDGLDTGPFCEQFCLCRRALVAAETTRMHLQRLMAELGATIVTDFSDKEYYQNIRRCIVAGFFLQSAFLEDSKSTHYITVKECQTAALHPTSSLEKKPECVVYNEFVLTSQNYIRTVTRVKAEWLVDFAPGFFDLSQLPEPGLKAAGLRRLHEERNGGGEQQQQPEASGS